MQLGAGGVEGALLIVRAVVNGRTTEHVDGVPEKPLNRKLTKRLVVVEIADDLAAKAPEVVDVVANGLR